MSKHEKGANEFYQLEHGIENVSNDSSDEYIASPSPDQSVYGVMTPLPGGGFEGSNGSLFVENSDGSLTMVRLSKWD